MHRNPPAVTVVADADALAADAARRIVACLKDAGARPAVCLAGGSTPERLYRRMAGAPYRDELPIARMHWFWGDERFVPQSDARSNSGAARRILLDVVPVPPGKIHPVCTSAGTADIAAERYEAELRSFYGAERLDRGRPLFDVVLMGLGADGHTASLFPGHAEVDETTRWVVPVDEAGLEPFVPRVSLTLPTLASTRLMLFLVSGRGKRPILARVLAGADLPAARAWSDGDLVWLVGRDAMPEQCDAP